MLQSEIRKNLLNRLNKDTLFFDGAMGTQLQLAGLKTGGIPEEMNIEKSDVIVSIHERYLNAGADFITTNTFGCNRLKMEHAKYSVEQMINAAIENAKTAQKKCGRENDSYIALDIGPIGQMLKPLGTLTFDEAYDIIAQQIKIAKDKVDVVLFETMTDPYELKAGILAVKENSDLPVFTTMTFEQNGRTLTGTDVQTFVNIAQALGVDALGVNCSLGPEELKPIINQLLETSLVPVMIQPNAGLPSFKNGQTFYELSPQNFANTVCELAQKGIAIAGGCCGTTPEFIKQLKEKLPAKVAKRNVEYKTAVSSQNKTVVFNGQVVVCGERLNPTGKKKLQAALREGRFDELVVEAIKQEEAGAHVLDVNVGLPGIDESETMKTVIPMLQEVINLPLQIDSSSAQAIETACRYYNGRPLINSVNGKDKILDSVLPIVKKYGGVVIGLTLEEGIPLLAQQRIEIAEKIISRAQKYGIRKEDVIIDCLTLTASAQQKEVQETLKALSYIRQNGNHTVLGVSNVSFGLPNRPLLNRTFLTCAIHAGLDLPIINPLDEGMMGCIDAYNVLYNIDEGGTKYIEKHAADVVSTAPSSTAPSSGDVKIQNSSEKPSDQMNLSYIIKRGMKDEAANQTKKELENTDAMTLINDVIIPALNQVGIDYEKGKIFLPQLIQSAETTKIAFEVVQQTFTTSEKKKGPIIICTVEGDIHDIGKNIVKVVLESYGFDVIDLGKDVKVEAVVDAWKKYSPKAIGLSALMTTTVVNMKRTIQALKEQGCKAPVWVGGAVLTQEIADEIGADYYTKDAMASVHLMEKII